MSSGIWQSCSNRLLPALDEIYPGKISIVTRKFINDPSKYKYFPNLEESFKFLSKNTCFIIATPPNTHFYFSKKILDSGRDVLVEKPSFFKNEELDNLIPLAISKKLVLAEMIMYLENQSTKI